MHSHSSRRLASLAVTVATIATLIFVSAGPASAVACTYVDFDGDTTCDLAVGTPVENIEDATDAGAVNVLYNGGTALSATADDYFHQNTSGGPGEEGELVDPAESSDHYAEAIGAGDFNGDGSTDLAVGVSLENIGGTSDAGAVDLIMADAPAGGTGLDITTNALLDQSDAGGAVESGDHFGASMAVGDFDDDGNDDLAIGAPYENITTTSSITDAGAVNVMYGDGTTGLNPAAATEQWTQENTDVNDQVESSDRFGWTLAADDFNDDGFDDLAIGIPYENNAGITDVGAVEVLYGSATGLDPATTPDQMIFQGTGAPGTAETSDFFGIALATGDLNSDGAAELVVGVPYEDVGAGPIVNAGVVHVLIGDAATDALLSGEDWTQTDTTTSAAADPAEAEDRFGWAVAVGNFDGTGDAELAVGAAYEDVTVSGSNKSNAGAVEILYSAADAALTSDEFYHQGTSIDAVEDKAESTDTFGARLAVSDFDGDGTADLVIGAPLENIVTTDDGVIDVVPGSGAGLDFTADALWHTNLPGVRGGQESSDKWSTTIAA